MDDSFMKFRILPIEVHMGIQGKKYSLNGVLQVVVKVTSCSRRDKPVLARGKQPFSILQCSLKGTWRVHLHSPCLSTEVYKYN